MKTIINDRYKDLYVTTVDDNIYVTISADMNDGDITSTTMKYFKEIDDKDFVTLLIMRNVLNGHNGLEEHGQRLNDFFKENSDMNEEERYNYISLISDHLSNYFMPYNVMCEGQDFHSIESIKIRKGNERFVLNELAPDYLIQLIKEVYDEEN